MSKSSLLQTTLAGFLIAVFSQSTIAGDYSENISEEYLRTQFSFGADEKLKYSQCEDKTYYTCTYVWGVDSKKDATRQSMGLAPNGNKLMVIYAQANRREDFQRVISSYSDPEKIDGVAAEAIWSDKRKQLSMITDKNLIIHINIDQENSEDSREQAISIADHLLQK